jgi:hypothetical protein
MNAQSAEEAVARVGTAETDQLEAHLQSRLSGRVRNLRLRVRRHGLSLEGQTRSYYAKQLAQQAVLEATVLPILANEIQVC